ncbi:hypothetical protein [Streptomyces sp. NPDC016734]
MIAHVALESAKWVLEAAGLGPETLECAAAWRRLRQGRTVDVLAEAHWDQALYSMADEDALWPLPIDAYIELIGHAIGIDLNALTARSAVPFDAISRFGAPLADDALQSIRGQSGENIGRFDPASWLVQRRVGSRSRTSDLTAELDRFVAHWSYKRDFPNVWVEVGRDEAISVIVAVQQTSLVWGPLKSRNLHDAHAHAEQFLGCFASNDRYFTNGCRFNQGRLDLYSFTIAGALMEAGVVAMDDRHAGIWWHAEGDRSTPLGMSP